MKKINSWGIVGLLICLDQSIKLYINYYHRNNSFSIIGEIIQFKPVLNDAYSWINSMLNLGVNRAVHIIFVILMIGIIYITFKFIKTKYCKSQLIDIAYILVLSGAFCSLIDKVFWGGSLDYIYLKGFLFSI